MRVQTILVAAATALLLAACTAAEPAAAPPADEGEAATVLDWVAREGAFDFANGWVAEFCEGDAPFVCVRDGDTVLGGLELIVAPAEGFDADHHVADFLDTFRADRAVGCPGHRLDAQEATPARVGGHDGVRYGFTLQDPDGTEVERVVKYVTAVDGALLLVGANASDPEGCMAGGIGEFAPADLAAIAGELDRLVADSVLPTAVDGGASGSALPDGEHAAFVVAFADDHAEFDLAELLTGEEARDAAVTDGQLPPGEDLPNDFYVRDHDDVGHRVAVGDDVEVRVYDCTRECALAPVPYADLVGGRARAMNGPHALFELVIAEGKLVALDEVYLP